jgi:hypothetical protein
MERASHDRAELELRISAVRLTFMSKLPSPRCDSENAFSPVFCDTFLFMLMLPDICEGGHAGDPTPHAYSTRCDILLSVLQQSYKALNCIRKSRDIRSHSGHGAQLFAQQPGSGRHEST